MEFPEYAEDVFESNVSCCESNMSDYGNEVVSEPCPATKEVTIAGCNDSVVFDAGDVDLCSQGRILQVDFTVKNVCPGKRVAVALILTEEDEKGKEHDRGVKTLVIPAHYHSSCKDVDVRCVKFVLPEELAEFSEHSSMCNCRKIRVRFLANYIDSGFECCAHESHTK